jgi:hypothetical protein
MKPIKASEVEKEKVYYDAGYNVYVEPKLYCRWDTLYWYWQPVEPKHDCYYETIIADYEGRYIE